MCILPNRDTNIKPCGDKLLPPPVPGGIFVRRFRKGCDRSCLGHKFLLNFASQSVGSWYVVGIVFPDQILLLSGPFLSYAEAERLMPATLSLYHLQPDSRKRSLKFGMAQILGMGLVGYSRQNRVVDRNALRAKIAELSPAATNSLPGWRAMRPMR